MKTPVRLRHGLVLLGLLVLGACLYNPASNLVVAFRLLMVLEKLADGEAAPLPTIEEQTVERSKGNRKFRALVYRIAGSAPDAAIVMTSGVTKQGCFHPRLRALSRQLAAEGLLVVTPDIEMFRRFRVSRKAVEEIVFWFQQIGGLRGGAEVRRAGLAGISFSGTLALMAAARPEIRNQCAFVFGVGAYQDLGRCMQGWFAHGPVTSTEGTYPVRFYGKWITMLASLDLIPLPADRQFLTIALERLLSQKPVPPTPASMSPEGRRWLDLALRQEGESDLELFAILERHLAPRLLTDLSPDAVLSRIRCPVFLLHGTFDELIPPSESVELAKRLDPQPHLLLTPFLTHTHPFDKPLGARDRLWAAVRMLAFLSRLAACL